eukprot:Ihof_evm11s95 gene=Ihof_evmTU11s95
MSNISLRTTFLGVELNGPLWNASGPECTTKQELDALGSSAAALILTKSITLEERAGNPEPRLKAFSQGSINSMGLPNLGVKAYLDILPTLSQHNKPVIASVSGMSLKDNLEILEMLYAGPSPPMCVEVNLSCPNLVGKPQVGYDFEQSKDVLKAVGDLCLAKGITWGVKLPPYFDFAHFSEIAAILNDSRVSFVTCINSPGNGLVIDPISETTLIRPKGGFGGIGGPGIKAFGLSNVRKLREFLKEDISVIGVGGITTGMDVFEYILCGATAVQ